GYAFLRHLQSTPWIVDSHGVIRTTRTGAFEGFQRTGGFGAVVDAVPATHWDKAINDVVQVVDRDFINREVTIVNAPLREIGRNHFIGVLRESFVIFLQGGGQR